MLQILTFLLFIFINTNTHAFFVDLSITTHHPLTSLFVSIGQVNVNVPIDGYVQMRYNDKTIRRWLGDSAILFDMTNGVETYDFDVYLMHGAVLLYKNTTTYNISKDCELMGFASRNCFFGQTERASQQKRRRDSFIQPSATFSVGKCDFVNVAFVPTHMPRFADDHSAYATLSVESGESYDDFRWIITVNDNIPVEFDPYQPFVVRLLANTNYRATVTVSRILYGYDKSVSDFICVAETPILKALPPLSINFIAPVQPFACDDIYLFRVAITNAFDTAIPLPTTTKGLATVSKVAENAYVIRDGLRHGDFDIQFVFGESRIVITDISTIVRMGLVSPPMEFSAQLLQQTSPIDEEPFCSEQTYSMPEIVVRNTSPFATRYTIDGVTGDFPETNSVPYGAQIYKQVTVWNGICPNITLFVPARFHIPTRVEATDATNITVINDIPELTVRHYVSDDKLYVTSFIFHTLSMEYIACDIFTKIQYPLTRIEAPLIVVDEVRLGASFHEISITTPTMDSDCHSAGNTYTKKHIFYLDHMGTYTITCVGSLGGPSSSVLVHVGFGLDDNPLIQSDAINTTRSLKCPLSMHPESMFNYEYIKADAISPDVESITVWNEDTMESASIDLSRPIYMVPKLGRYVFEVVENSTGAHYFSTPFRLVEPAISFDAFTVKVAKYPSCDGLSDGVIALSFPKGLAIDILVISCSECKEHVEVAIDSEMGMATLSNLPYFGAMEVQYIFEGTPCRFSKTISMLRVRETVVASLEYVPTCGSDDHMVIALDRFGEQMYQDDRVSFSWGDSVYLLPWDVVVSGKNVSVDLVVSISDTCKSSASISFLPVKPPHVRVKSRPVFCPFTSDAALQAETNMPRATLEWTDENGSSVSDRSAVQGGHTYTATLRTDTCVASDSVYVAEKTRFQLDYHSIVVYGEDGTVSVSIDDEHESEIDTFMAEMLSSDDRQFLDESENGATTLSGIPEGYSLYVNIPYPDDYKMQQAMFGFCKDPWRAPIHKRAEFSTYIALERRSRVYLEQDISAKPHEILAHGLYETRTNVLADSQTLVETYGSINGDWESTITYNIAQKEERRTMDDGTIRMVLYDSALPPPSPSYEQKEDTICVDKQRLMTLYVHGIRDPSPYVVEDSNDSVFYLHDSGIDYWTYIVVGIVLKANGPYSIELVSRQRDNKRLTVQTFPVSPLFVVCYVDLSPSSIYSLDGRVRVSISGGMAPFYLDWADLAVANYTYNTYSHRSGMGVGVYSLKVIDSAYGLENSATCSVNLHATSDSGFRISSITAETPTGCAPYVQMIIHAVVSGGTPALVSAWNIVADSPITTCGDGRMEAVTNVYDVTTTVVGEGTWRVAICNSANFLVTSNGQDQYLEPTINNTFPLAVSNVTLGETCTEPSDNVTLTTKVPITMVVSKPLGTVSVYQEGSVPVSGDEVAVDTDSVLLRISGLVTGLHTLTVEDERQCPAFVSVLVNNTGLEICGTCNRSETACQDQCKVPYGNNTCLYDCIIDGLDAIKDRNQSSILLETIYCLDRGIKVVGNIENDLSDAYVDLVIESSVFTDNKTFENLIFDSLFHLSADSIIFESCAFVGLTGIDYISDVFFYDCGSYGDSTVQLLPESYTNVSVHVLNGTQLDTLRIAGYTRPNELFFEFGEDSRIEHIELVLIFDPKSNVTNGSVICDMFKKYNNGEFGTLKINGGIAYTTTSADTFCASFGGIVVPKKTLSDNVPAKSIISAIIIVQFTIVLFGTLFSLKKIQ